MMLRITVILFLLMIVHECHPERILAIFAAPSQSHMNLKSPLLKELVARGHHVTAVTPIPEKTLTSNYEEIVIPDILRAFNKIGGKQMFDMRDESFLTLAFSSTDKSYTLCKHVLKEPGIQKLIHTKNAHFDLIILEAFFSECFLAFGVKFKAPIVKFCTFGGTEWMFDWIGNPNPYSYVPDVFLDYDDKMTFSQRIWNTLTGTLFRIVRRYYYLPRINELVKNFFNETENLPSLFELEDTSTSLLLLNNHFSISYPRPLLPNVIQVGGLHIRAPKKLPQDIEKFLNEAPHGVIFFSMGSILQSSNLPESKIKTFLEAFSKMKEKILWKWETEALPGQPNNVKLGKWLPQSDILAHPNVRAFMTHGGLLSSQETIDRGVPIVGIPIFGDQKLNVARAEGARYGIILDFHNISTESVIWALREILDNPKYRENVQRISRIFRDQPMTPMEKAVYWTEYVIRHKGAPHMRSAALDLTWYQYYLLDVIAVLSLAIVTIILVVFIIFRAIFHRLCYVTSGNIVSIDRKNK